MPRAIITSEDRQREKLKKMASVIEREISIAMAAQNCRTRKELARESGMSYFALLKRLNGEAEWSVPELVSVCDALDIDNETRGVMLGGSYE